MNFRAIQLKGKPLTLHKAVVAPIFGATTVLTRDVWKYVELWLTREGKKSAVLYWQQAEQFYRASQHLPITSSPLTGYYCILNGVKALLDARGHKYSDRHGVHAQTKAGKTCLSNELVTFQGHGVLAALCSYLGEPVNKTYPLKDLLYNLPFVHRTYCLTYTSDAELFIPLSEPTYVQMNASDECWFCALVSDPRHARGWLKGKLPSGFEKDSGVDDLCVVRFKKRFKRKRSDKSGNSKRLTDYHKKIRKHVAFIRGPEPLWYMRRGLVRRRIDRSSLTMTFAAMYAFSHLSRYKATRLSRHLECQHNWLISEYLSLALDQFLDEVSSEITGNQFLAPGQRRKDEKHWC